MFKAKYLLGYDEDLHGASLTLGIPDHNQKKVKVLNTIVGPDAVKIHDALIGVKKEEKPGCPYCIKAQPLMRGDTDDSGIAIRYPDILVAYGYDVHGMGKNGISVKIKFCPMCGRKLKKNKEV